MEMKNSKGKPMAVGQLVTARDGRRYRVANVAHTDKDRGRIETLQLERETPKVKGKAARKAEKRERRLTRESSARFDGAVAKAQA